MSSIAPAVLVLAFAASACPALAQPTTRAQVEALRLEAYDAAYNLDYERSVDLFHKAIAADPNDPATLRGIASVTWLRILFLRGTVLAEDYTGRISGDVKLPDPPADLDRTFQESIAKSIALAEKSVDRRYGDPSAHYDLSAALGIAASYAGTIRGSLWGAMRLARRAVSEGQIVLKLDRGRREAGLVVGTYRYVVSMVPFGLRWVAYIIGFEGGKQEGIRQIEEAADQPNDAQTDARFALVLLYNREKRYNDAVVRLRQLEQSFPGNRLLRLEEASTLLRGSRPADALAVLDEAMAKLTRDDRPRMVGEEARWFLKRGIARLQLGMLNEAEGDLKAALASRHVGIWVQARIHIEMGKVADLRANRNQAKSEYEAAAALAERAGDEEARLEAVRLQSQAYRRK